MSWLHRYKQDRLWRMLHLIDQYQQGSLAHWTFMSDMDRALDIWENPPQDWSDPLLNEWATLLNTYGGATYPETTRLNNDERFRINEALRELKAQIYPIYDEQQYKAVLASLDAYEAGEISVGDLIAQLWSMLTDVYNIPQEQLDELQGQMAGLERAYEVEILRGRDELDQEVQGWIRESIQEIRASIASMSGKQDTSRASA